MSGVFFSVRAWFHVFGARGRVYSVFIGRLTRAELGGNQNLPLLRILMSRVVLYLTKLESLAASVEIREAFIKSQVLALKVLVFRAWLVFFVSQRFRNL